MDNEPPLQTNSIFQRLRHGFAARMRPPMVDNMTALTPTQVLENKILTLVINTAGNILTYSETLGFSSRDEFINYIRCKKIADIGSGFDGFALDVLLRRLDTTVIPINPARTTSSFADNRRKELEELRPTLWPDHDMQAIDAALLEVDQRAIVAFAHDLSAIPDEEVDMVIDNKGVFYYADPQNEEIYERSIKEMLRIVKPGGRILIGDKLHLQLGAEPWYKRIFDRLGLDYHYLEKDTGKPGLAHRYGVGIIKQ